MAPRFQREAYTVGWVCALAIELAAAQEMLDEEHEGLEQDENDSNLYSLGSISGHKVVLACLPAGQTGNNSAAAVAMQMKASFNGIRFGLMVGIGGGVPSEEVDIRLGDVVVSQPAQAFGGVVQYDFGKATSSGFERTGSLNAPPPILLSAVAKMQANHLRRRSNLHEYICKLSHFPEFTRASAGPDILFEATYNHVGGRTCETCSADKTVEREPEERGEVVIHYGTIASGNQVIRDGSTRDTVSAKLGGVLCFDMEAAGLMNTFPCLAIRGICDYADSHKNKKWQAYAAATAAACAKEVLSVIPLAEVAQSPTVDRIIREKNALEDALSRLPYAIEAPFNSYQKQREPTCLTDTRVDLLREIYNWADGQDERCIFWLNGLAGTGKSTIARTVARKYYKQKRLGASFFFSRGGGDISHAEKFVGTIATQLAETSDTFKSLLVDAILSQGGITSKVLKDQWDVLILQPLSKLEAGSFQGRLLIVIDALDECEESDVGLVLQLLSDFHHLGRLHFRVFITSRPDISVRHGFSFVHNQVHREIVLHDISRSIVDHDIFTFLQHALTDIRQKRDLGRKWPGDENIRHLVRKSAGLFVWAATTCRFIDEGGFLAPERLSDILEGESSNTEPEEELNNIYTKVLENSINPSLRPHEKYKAYKLVRTALGAIVTLFSPLPASSLARLLHQPENNIVARLGGVRSILDIPRDSSRPVRLHHPSLRDFLLSSQRCHDVRFWVDEKKVHEDLAKSCIQVMFSSLKRDICGLHAPGTLVSAVERSKIEQCLLPDLQYACCYFVQHLQRSEICLVDDCEVHKFLQKHLLHWLEALSLIGKASDSIQMVADIESMVQNKNSNLHAIIYDIKRFVLYNRSIIEEAPLQLYSAALIFCPKTSIVRQQFLNQLPQWICRSLEVQETWRAIVQTLEGHSDLVCSVAFSPDGKLLASASKDRTVRLWDAVTGASRSVLEGHSNSVHSVAFSPDSKLLASASSDMTVRLWDVVTGVSRGILEGHLSLVNAVVFSPNGKLLASASDDKIVKLWDAMTGALHSILEDHLDRVKAVAFSPDGKLLASASSDKTVRLWDTVTGVPCSVFEGHSGSVLAVAFSPNGKLLASASSDRVRLWDIVTGMLRGVLEGHLTSIYAVAFSPNGKLLASISSERVRLWNVLTKASVGIHEIDSFCVSAVAFSVDGKLLAFSEMNNVKLWDVMTIRDSYGILAGHSNTVKTVAFSLDGKLLASASYDMTIRLWDAVTGAPRGVLKGHSNSVRSVAFSMDSKLLASASYDKTVRLWDTVTGVSCGVLEGHSSKIYAVAFSPDGKLLASASEDDTVRLWDAITGASRGVLGGYSGWVSYWDIITGAFRGILGGYSAWGSLRDTMIGVLSRVLEDHLDWLNTVSFSPDGKLLASTSYDYTVRLWDAAIGVPYGVLAGHSNSVNIVAFSPDSKLLASASSDKTVRLWDTATRVLCHILRGHSHMVNTVAFSTDGRLLASASSGNTVRLWDAVTGASHSILEGHSYSVNTVAFSPDNKLLASASSDNTVRLWDAVTGAPRDVFEGHSSTIYAVAFSTDSRLLASASNDKTVRLWDTVPRMSRRILGGHSNKVEAVAFSPDGKLLASASRDKTVRLWDVMTGASRYILRGHSSLVNLVAFSPDGKLLASASYDNTVRLWDTVTGAPRGVFEGHSNIIYTVTFSPDGKLLASASGDKTVRLWDTVPGVSCHVLRHYLGWVNTVGILAFPVRLWDTITGAPFFKGHLGWVSTIAILANVVAFLVNTAILWNDAVTGASRSVLKGHSKEVQVVAFSLDGKLLASASGDNTVRLWDAVTGAPHSVLEGHSGSVRAVAFSPDSKLLASASCDNTVRLWDAVTGAPCSILEGHSGSVLAVAFSPDSKLLASASYDNTVRLWDIKMTKVIKKLSTEIPIRDLSFSNDGSYLKTECGLLKLNSLNSVGLLEYEFLSFISVKKQWITCRNKNILWLPTEYRPTCSAVQDNVLIMGHASGQVTFIEIDMATIPLDSSIVIN